MTSVRVLIVDDDPLVRGALSLMLDGVDGISVVGEAGDGDEVPAAVAATSPDVVLMDIRMPRTDGITATRLLRARGSAPTVVMLTTFDSDDHLLPALQAGASGFLLKDTSPRLIADAVLTAAAGDPILAPAITWRLMERAAQQAGGQARASSALAALSAREREVLRCVAAGRSNLEIAAELYLSLATVKAYVSSLLTKLDLDNRTQLALLAQDAGLV
jgi:DNA-binding NarL/FixJ family response regulator